MANVTPIMEGGGGVKNNDLSFICLLLVVALQNVVYLIIVLYNTPILEFWTLKYLTMEESSNKLRRYCNPTIADHKEMNSYRDGNEPIPYSCSMASMTSGLQLNATYSKLKTKKKHPTKLKINQLEKKYQRLKESVPQDEWEEDIWHIVSTTER